MNGIGSSAEVVRFGLFELDTQNRELRKRGLRLRVETKPLQVLELLVARPGEIITRKQMQQTLWPDTYVTFDFSLNTAINKLRAALGDSAESPRFIETIARRGYRFIGTMRTQQQVQPAGADEKDSQRATRPASGPASTVPSIAVLPFQNMSGQAELEYLSDGLGEAVIRRASQIPGVRVMAWSTVMRYKRREMDALEMGRELAVSSVLVGRVRPSENSITMNLELVDVENGWQLWGQEYSRASDEIQELPEEIARELAQKLRRTSSAEGQERWAKHHTQNPEAYSDYLHGRHHWYRLSPDSLTKSVAYFESAIEKDSEFALAHAALAEAYLLYAFIGILHPRKALSLGHRAASRALEIDDELPEAHASFADVMKFREWNWETAEREYQRCLELDANNSMALRGYGGMLSALGRSQEALAQIRAAQAVDPLSLIIGIDVAWNLYMAREYEESVAHAMKTLEMEPEFPATMHTLGVALVQLKKYDEAIAWFRKSSERVAFHHSTLASLAHACATCGKQDEARGLLKNLEEMATKIYVSPFCVALVHAGLGANERALEQLEKAFEEHDVWLMWLNREPRLDCLRGERRFRRMIERMKFPAQAEA